MMAGWRRSALAGLCLAVVAMLGSGQVAAQETPAPLLTLDQDRFFLESEFGKAAVERERVATAALEQENKRIEAELVTEEQALTDLRKTLSATDFKARADAFDQKVERIRAEQDAKSGQLTSARDKDRQEFLKAAVPVLGELLGKKKATMQEDSQTPNAELQARIAAGVPTPAVTVPYVKPVAA